MLYIFVAIVTLVALMNPWLVVASIAGLIVASITSYILIVTLIVIYKILDTVARSL